MTDENHPPEPPPGKKEPWEITKRNLEEKHGCSLDEHQRRKQEAEHAKSRKAEREFEEKHGCSRAEYYQRLAAQKTLESEQAEREYLYGTTRKPRTQQAAAPPRPNYTGTPGRAKTPWKIFKDADFDRRWLTPVERKITDMVWRVMEYGWGPRDPYVDVREHVEIMPSLLRGKYGWGLTTIKRAVRKLLEFGLLEEEGEREPGDPYHVNPGWVFGCAADWMDGEGPHAATEEEITTAQKWTAAREITGTQIQCLRISLGRIRAIRKRFPRDGGSGTPRKKAAPKLSTMGAETPAQTNPSMPTSMPTTMPTSMPTSMPTPPRPPNPDNDYVNISVAESETTETGDTLKLLNNKTKKPIRCGTPFELRFAADEEHRLHRFSENQSSKPSPSRLPDWTEIWSNRRQQRSDPAPDESGLIAHPTPLMQQAIN